MAVTEISTYKKKVKYVYPEHTRRGTSVFNLVARCLEQ